ncbi:hypothetical protein YC2023_007688 [Brassica napus]
MLYELSDRCSLSVLLTAAGCVIAALEDFLLIFSVFLLAVLGDSRSFTGYGGLCSTSQCFFAPLLTTTIVGVLKGVGSTTQGFVLLGGVEVHALNVSGLVVNTAGGVWYSYAKYRQKKAKPAKLLTDLEAHKKNENI